MQAIIFYISYGAIWVITLLPLRVLYIFSDLIYFILYYFPKYRKDVVAQNLKNSFPDKTPAQLVVIEKKFYRHLSDIFVETLKLTHMSVREQKKRFTYTGLDIIEKLKEDKRDVIAVLGHYNNWEWPTMIPIFMKYKSIIIYKPLQNKYYDRLIRNQRAKFGLILTPTSQVLREIIKYRRENINTLSIFIADQIPAKGDIRYWTTFLNQDTAVHTGAGKIAPKYDMAVVFFHIKKIKRGYYNLDVELLLDHTAGLTEETITESHVKRLEELINNKPEFWIWSHKRWKHKKPVDA